MGKGNVFIKRPVMAGAISIIILMVGAISLFTLPVEQYPDIAPPTVYVVATYTGADAEAVMNSVVMPLEESINGVENMDYITSKASNNGSCEIVVYFKQGTDPDMATVNVQNKVSMALGLLPAEVTRIGVTVVKRQNSMLQIGTLTSPSGKYDKTFLANYLDINVAPRIRRIQGVGEVVVLGDTYSMRIWMKPDVMAQYGLVPAQITAVLGEQNIVAPTGSLGENSDNTYQITMKYKGRLKSVDEFKNIVVASKPDGSVLLLKDVADVELGTLSYGFDSQVDGAPGVTFMTMQVAGANATEVNSEIDKLKEEITAELPEGVEFVTMMTSNDFLFASIENVVWTLIIAVILVVLVVYFFLQDFKATLIPSISIICSLIGTFACMQLAGFSINILTLFALVLAIGTVVDNSIVVVEAVQSKFEAGYRSPYLASKDAMSDVTMAIITCTLVFMAVFIPVCFMGGTSGKFYTQFGITMATAVGLSLINSLTLCPALCAILMRPSKYAGNSDHLREAYKRRNLNYWTKLAYRTSFNATMKQYKRYVKAVMNHPYICWGALVIALVALVWLMSTTKTSLVPQEDQGVIMVNVGTSPGSTLSETRNVMKKVEAIIKKQPEVEHYSTVAGNGFLSGEGTSYGMAIARLKNWDDRKGSEHVSDEVMKRLMAEFSEIKEADIFCFQPAMIPGYGTGNSIELYLQDRRGGDREELYQQTLQFISVLNQREEVGMAYTTFAMNYPQFDVDIDATECKRAGISPSDVLDVIGAYCGGSYVSNYNEFGKVYRVMLQAAPQYRLDEHALDNMFVHSGSEMAPVSQFARLVPTEGAEVSTRFNLYSSIQVNVSAAEGYATGEVQKAVKEVAAQVLPQGYAYEYGGMSREEARTADSNITVFIYAVAVLLIYLILCCLYESWFVPLAVILSVPFGLMGSFLFAKIWGLENNIYLQTGVIMLIGLLSKTAILITEFALDRRRKGMSIRDAAFAAAQDRLRPILMTVLTLIFGMIPLMFATGAGANGNSSLGIGVVGGSLIGTIALLFVVPVFFIFFETIQEKFRKPLQLEADEEIQNEKEDVMADMSAFNPENDDNK